METGLRRLKAVLVLGAMAVVCSACGTLGNECEDSTSCDDGEFCEIAVPGDGVGECVRGGGGGTGGSGGTGGTGGSGGSPGTTCGPLGSRLVIVLSWEAPAVELDVGGETPEVNEPSNNFGAGPPAPDKDPQCTHDGDEPTGTGVMMERVVCEPLFDPTRTYTGDWTIRVDNFDDTERDYDLLATMDGVDLPGFPQSGSVDGNGGFVDIMFCVQ